MNTKLLAILMLVVSRAALLSDEHYGGVGVNVIRALRPPGLMIEYVFPNSSAADAGLRDDLHIHSINGISATEMKAEEAKYALRGQVGTKMDLIIFDPVSEQTHRVVLTNDLIEVKVFPRPGPEERFPYNTYPGKIVKVRGNVSFARLASISVTTNHVLRVVTTNGAIASFQLTGYSISGMKTNVCTETMNYDWTYRTSRSAPLLNGTNTAFLTQIYNQRRPGRYRGTETSNYEDGLLKAGDDARLSFGGIDEFRKSVQVLYRPWEYRLEAIELKPAEANRK
jgi:hypothetical protein